MQLTRGEQDLLNLAGQLGAVAPAAQPVTSAAPTAELKGFLDKLNSTDTYEAGSPGAIETFLIEAGNTFAGSMVSEAFAAGETTLEDLGVLDKAAGTEGLSWVERYALNEKSWAEREKRGREAHGTAATLGMVGGMVASLWNPLAKLALLTKLPTAIPAAIGMGAIAGYGASENKDDMEKLTEDILTGAAFAGVLGGAFGAIKVVGTKLKSKAGKEFQTALSKPLGQQDKVFMDHVEKVLSDRSETNSTISSFLRQQILEPKGKLDPTTASQIDTLIADLMPAKTLQTLNKVALGKRSSDPASLIRKNFVKHQLGGLHTALQTGNNFRKLQDTVRSMSDEDFQRVFEVTQFSEITSKLVKQGIAPSRRFGGDPLSLKGYLYFSDAMPVYEEIDSTLGTRLYQAAATAAGKNEISNARKFGFAETALKLRSQLAKEKVSTQSLYAALSTGEFSELPLAAQPAAKQLGEMFSLIADDIEAFSEGAIRIPRKAGSYVPKRVMQQEAFMPAWDARLKEALPDITNPSKLTTVTEDQFQRLKETDAGQDILDYVNWINSRKHPYKTADDFNRGLVSVINPTEHAQKKRRLASFLYKRQPTEATIPEWALERNPFQLLKGYMNEGYEQAAYNPFYDKSREAIAMLNTLATETGDTGAKAMADHLTSIVSDLAGGVDKNTFYGAFRDSISRLKVGAARKAEAATNPVSKTFYKALEASPDFVGFLGSLIYPNVLGFNIGSAMVNAAQPLMMTLPELGTAYGSRLMWNATMEMASPKAKRAAEEGMKKLGLMSAPVHRASNRQLKQSIEQSGFLPRKLLAIGDSALENVNNLSMGLFQEAEKNNRRILWPIARDIVADAKNLHPDAMNYLGSLPSATKHDAMRLLQTGNEAELTDVLLRHLTAKTALTYDKVAASKFARHMGPMFSVFTKWPTSIAGDIVSRYRTEGIPKASLDLIGRYITPLFYMATLETAVNQLAPKQKEAFFGEDRFAITERVAPIFAASPMNFGRFGKPPVIEAISKIWEARESGKALQYQIGAGMSTFMPLGAIPRALGVELPSLIDGQKTYRTPSRKDFFGQIEAADRELQRLISSGAELFSPAAAP